MITTGDIVRASFTYLDDESKFKDRYGLVISQESYHDLFAKRRYLLAFISTSIPKRIHPDWEFIIEEGTEEFKQSCLKKSSIVKVHRIKIVQEENIKEKIGSLPPEFVQKVRKCLTLF